MPRKDSEILVDSTRFEQPEIDLGWPVIWRHSPGEPGATGIVTRVHDRAVDLIVYPPDSTLAIRKSAVRHIDDPSVRVTQTEDGCWEHTKFTEKMLRLSSELATIPE